GERLPHLGLAACLLSEGLRTCDVGERAVAILAGNARGILRVQEPVDVRELTRPLVAGLRNEGEVAELGQPRCGRLAVAGPDGVDLMERKQHVCASKRGPAQVVSGVRGQLPVARQPALERGRVAFSATSVRAAAMPSEYLRFIVLSWSLGLDAG